MTSENEEFNKYATPVAWMTPCGVVASDAEKSRNVGRAPRSSFTIPLYLRPEPATTPAGGQSRFAGQEWSWCAPEHVRMVHNDPRYAAEGYEARYLYASPAQSQDSSLRAAVQELVEALQVAEQKLVELEHRHGGGDDEIYIEGAILTARAALAKHKEV